MIKLKPLLYIKESPDKIKYNKKEYIWSNWDATAFFIFGDGVFIIGPNLRHEDIKSGLQKAIDAHKNNKDVINVLDNIGIFLFNIDVSDISSFYFKLNKNETISGRIWEDKKVISFWNTQKEVMTKFHWIETFIKDIKRNPLEFKYNFSDDESDSILLNYNQVAEKTQKDIEHLEKVNYLTNTISGLKGKYKGRHDE